jgi:hypothetical protein
MPMRDTMEFCHFGGCVRTERIGDTVELSDTKDQALGPLVVHSLVEYQRRIEDAYLDADPTVMFDGPEQYKSLTTEELDAYRTYIRSTLLHELEDGDSIIAFGDERTLRMDEEVVA